MPVLAMRRQKRTFPLSMTFPGFAFACLVAASAAAGGGENRTAVGCISPRTLPIIGTKRWRTIPERMFWDIIWKAVNSAISGWFAMGLSGGNDERLWKFDPAKPLETGEAFTPVGWIGATFLSVALGGDRVYFVQYRDLADARRFMPESFRDLPADQVEFDAVLHLRSIPVAPGSDGRVTDHGPLVDARGRTALMVESLAADARGNVFMVGSWSVADPDEGAMQYVWPGQGFWRDLEPEKFHRMGRGEFFGFVPGAGPPRQ